MIAPTKRRPVCIALICGGLLLAAESRGAAQAGPETAQEELEAREYVFGVKVAQVNVFVEEHDEAEHGAGVGLFFETDLVPGRLDIEIGFAAFVLPDVDIVELPVDVLLKLPYFFGDVAEVYAAAGLTFGPVIGEDDTALQVGGAFVVGSYIFLNSHWGLDFEVDYALLTEEGELVHELTFALGAVFRL